jgi:hypothetical protein
LETDIVAGKETSTCTWSSVPPTARAFISFCRAIPPKYGQRRSLSAAEMTFRRFFVLNTKCIRQLE